MNTSIILKKGLLGLALAGTLTLSACGGGSSAPEGEDNTVVQLETSDGGVKPADPSLDLSDPTTTEAKAALGMVCNGLTEAEAAEALGVPAVTYSLVEDTDDEGNPEVFCAYMEPGAEWSIVAGDDKRGDHWLTVQLDGAADNTGTGEDVHGVVDVPGVGTGTYGGDDDTTLYISPRDSLYEVTFAVFLPHDEMDFPTVEAFQTATAQAAEAAF